MSNPELKQLLEKYLNGNCREDEKIALEQWYESYHARHADELPAPDLNSLYREITAQLQEEGSWAAEERPKPRILTTWRAVAAAALIVITGSMIWWLMPVSGQELLAETGAGVRKQLRLPDGSTVHLNVSSSLRYPAGMKGSTREVYLKGEAYFDIARKPDMPFILHTDLMTVKVLGTRFNVRHYEGDESMEATLLEGSVRVSGNSHSDSGLQLNPGEKLLLLKAQDASKLPEDHQYRLQQWGDHIAVVIPPSARQTDIVWTEDRLEFRDKSFQELVKMLSRWYGKTIILEDSSLNDNRFAGTFKTETVAEVLKALQETADFKYRIKGDSIFIHQK